MKNIYLIFLFLSTLLMSMCTVYANTQPSAQNTTVNTAPFNKNLNSSDSNVQAALQTIDQLSTSGGSAWTITDGSHTVANVSLLTVSGATVGGTSPNATLTVTGSGSGTVTSAGYAGDGVIFNSTVSGSPITTSGTFVPALLTQTKNTFLSGPSSGSNVTPTFRGIVGADLPNPSATTLGGIESAAAVSHEWINSISTSGVPALSQPAYTDLSGSVPAITALTGDVTATGPGSSAATLATVNSNVGSFSYSSITVNAKGLVTAASNGTAPATAANPTASVNTSPVNGSASTFMRSDAAPQISQSMSPTWTGNHIFAPSSGNTNFTAGNVGIGTAAPSLAALQVLGNGADSFYANQSSGSSGQLVGYTGSTSSAEFLGKSAGFIVTEGQKFKLTQNATICSTSFQLGASNGSPSGTIQVSIQTDNGSGTSPSGSLLNGNLTVAVTPSASAVNLATFPGCASGVANTFYWIVYSPNTVQTNGVYWTINIKNGGAYTYDEYPALNGVYSDETGYANYFTVNGTASHSPVVIDANNNVGIQQSSPQSVLDVNGGEVLGAIYSGTTPSPANGLIVQGNVGIGSTAPGQVLDVQGTVRTIGFSIANVNSTTATGTGAMVFGTSPSFTTPVLGTPSSVTLTNGTGLPESGVTSLVAAGKTFTSSNTLTLAGTDSTTMTFPTTSATIARTDASNTFTGHQTIEGVTSAGATGTGNLVFSSSPVFVTPALGTPGSGVATNLTGTASGLTSGITNALASATTTVNVSSATAPTNGQVLTATGATTATWQTSTTGSGTVNAGTAGQGSYYATSTTAVSGTSAIFFAGNTSGSNIGIGSSAPGIILDVQGTIRSLGHVISGTGTSVWGNDNANYIQNSAATLGNLNSYTNSLQRMTILNNGNVGIGTVTPPTLLYVAGTTTTQGFQLPSNGAGAGNVLVGNAIGIGTWMPPATIGAGGGGSGTVNSGTTGQGGYYASSTTAVSGTSAIFFSGNASGNNIGIGSAAPGTILDIQGTVRSLGVLVNGNVGIGTTFINGAGESALTVMNGNVGIGTWVPTQAESINGSINTFGNTGNTLLNQTGGNVGIGTTVPGATLSVVTPGVSTQNTSFNTNVGIGTVNPAYLLAVGATSNFGVNTSGIVPEFNNISTVNNGVPSEVAVSNLTAQSAAITATTLYAVPATGYYRVSWTAVVTTAGTSSTLGGANGMTLKYTSPDDSVVKTESYTTPSISAGNTTGTAISGVNVAYCKTGTNLQYLFGYTSAGTAMVYSLHIAVEAL